ncbi:hypothetical protein [Solirhodobacter olei]|uniref:hypothetical protein n=1 Tax=Solirhodobacter olei TaxID=2493082 RepID=UPI000FD6E211|nr:hypothetical protein [Solirhodobacter olei]
MAYEWIIDVLTDLGTFARVNGLAELAGKADEALDAARRDIGERRGREAAPLHHHPPADRH